MIQVDLTALPKLTNDVYYPLFKDKSRYLVLKGGGGSGKSVFAAQKLIVRMLSEPKHRFLVCRKVAKTLRESCFALLKEMIYTWGLGKLFTFNETDMKIKCINGNEILFAGLDDVEKLKSIQGITGLWLEEASELLVEDWRQLDIRLRTKVSTYLQMIITFNPISITHWLKSEFFDNPKENATLSETTYRDNRFLTSEAVKVLLGFKDTDPYYYMVYCEGQWGVLGKTIFNAEIVTNRIIELKNMKRTLKRGYFMYDYVNEQIVDSTIKWVDDENGYITIYEDKQDYVPYVISGDTAGEGSDYFASHVLNNNTGKQAAVLHSEFDEDLYTKQVYCLGRHYNNALIGIEANFSTYPIRELERLRYPYQYVREAVDTFTNKMEKRHGFRTDKLTRPLIISNLVQLVREHPELFDDIPTLEEMLTFVRDEKGKPQAQEGMHDDLIMALCIAYHIREQQRFSVVKPKEEKTKIEKDKERLAKQLNTFNRRQSRVLGG